MRECRRHLLLNMIRKLVEIPLLVYCTGDHQCVGKEATQLIQFGPTPAGYRHTYGELLLSAVAADQQLVSRHQHTEQSDPLLSGELSHALHQRGFDEERRIDRPSVALRGRARKIGRQLENQGSRADVLLPEIDLCPKALPAQVLPLPAA